MVFGESVGWAVLLFAALNNPDVSKCQKIWEGDTYCTWYRRKEQFAASGLRAPGYGGRLGLPGGY